MFFSNNGKLGDKTCFGVQNVGMNCGLSAAKPVAAPEQNLGLTTCSGAFHPDDAHPTSFRNPRISFRKDNGTTMIFMRV